jgi:hypothetical protein
MREKLAPELRILSFAVAQFLPAGNCEFQEVCQELKHGTFYGRSGPGLCVKVAAKRLRQEVLALRDSATLSSIVVPRQRRGKSLMRRRYQQGHVFQKGRQRSEKWASDEPAYVRFWKDIPGQPNSKRTYVRLGICRTRTIAERKAAEKLERLGINSNQYFIEATSSITFQEQGEWWKSLSKRKRNPLEQTTIENRRYALDK